MKNPTCYRCGGPHLAPPCRFKETICRFCTKKGHDEKVCRSKANPKQSLSAPKRNFYVQEEQTLQLEDAEAYGMYTGKFKYRVAYYFRRVFERYSDQDGVGHRSVSLDHQLDNLQANYSTEFISEEVCHSPKNLHRRIHQSPGNHICECKVW